MDFWLKLWFLAIEHIQWTIMQNMAEQGSFDFYAALTMVLCGANFCVQYVIKFWSAFFSVIVNSSGHTRLSYNSSNDHFTGVIKAYCSLKLDFHSPISPVAEEIFTHEKCSDIRLCPSEPSN